MFIGHFGVGFAAKKFAPGISLGALIIATQFLDLLWPSLLLLDLEHVRISPGITKVTPLDFYDYPISHSLGMVVLWGMALGLTTFAILKNRKYAFIIFLCVLSHWFLDLLMHRPDLPLLPGGSAKFGLGLWNFPLLTIIVEALLFLGGVWTYTRATSAKNKFGKYGLMGLVVFLLLIQVGNMAGPAPTDTEAIAWSAQAQWLLVILALFVDKNREFFKQQGKDAKILNV